MYSRHALWFPLALATMLALVTFWINQAVEKSSPKSDGSNRHDRDYVLNNFYTTKTDLMGNLHYILAATEMEHFPDDDSTVLQRPRFTQYAINKPYTQISSSRGYVSSNAEEVQFVDDVVVVRPGFKSTGETQIFTEKLMIYPDSDIIKTDSPVVIKQFPKTEIHATGFVMNKKDQTLVLGTGPNKATAKPDRVHVHYERPAALKKASNKITISKPIAPATQSTIPSKNTQIQLNRSMPIKKRSEKL
ncbi:MAG: LPS export ABC transporter periplasmic protein LptC [Methylophilaceae bacterium]|nr:LPS export ABC transporter periplasmic protein LptC [Methylophilaceae bacterium]